MSRKGKPKSRPRRGKEEAKSRAGVWTVAAGALFAIAAAAFLWRSDGGPTETAPKPPAPDLSGFEPMVVRAIQDARAAAARAPESAPLWGELGKIFWVYELNAAARECLARACELAPKDGRLAYYHSLTFLPDDIEGCVPILSEAVELLGGEGLAPRIRLARLLATKGDLEAAEAQFRRILTLDSKNPVAQFGLGRIANVAGRFDEASQWLRLCRTNRYTAKAANQILAGILLRQGDPEGAEAAKKMAETIETEWDWPDPFVAEAAALKVGRKAWLDGAEDAFRRGKLDASEALVRRLLEHYPEESKAYLFRGRIELRRRQLNQAVGSFREAVQRDADAVEARVQLGVALMYQQNHVEAEQALMEAIALSPNLPEARFNLGLCLSAMGQTSRAISAFEAAIRLKPNLIDAYIGLANALARNGQLKRAAEIGGQAAEIDPGDARVAALLDAVGQALSGQAPPNGDSGL